MLQHLKHELSHNLAFYFGEAHDLWAEEEGGKRELRNVA